MISAACALDRFWLKVLVGGPDDCWPWLSARDRDGYGQFKTGGRQVKAHRHALALSGVAIADDQKARHTCDNPPCCNPGHVLPGTNQDNSDDAVARGRQARGEGHGRARLTEADLAAIDSLHSYGLGYRAIAGRFGVSKTTVEKAVKRQNWSHVPAPTAAAAELFR